MIDTTHINRERVFFAEQQTIWLFGYGSLIWKAEFSFHERRPAYIEG